MPDGKLCPEQFRGWLLKWTNYIKGYQRRWFVLSSGLLSYYRTQEEMAHTCRGTINLAGAFIDTIDATNFVITNGTSQVYLRALNEVERQRWVTALELAKAKAIKKLESDDSDSQSGSEDEGGGTEDPLAAMKEKLTELNTSHDLVVKNSHHLLKLLTEEEGSTARGSSAKLKEKMALFKLTAANLVKMAEEFMVHAHQADRRWTRALQHERSLRQHLQENIENLGKQMHSLESEARRSLGGEMLHPGEPAVGTAVSHDPSLLSQDSASVGDVTISKSSLDSPERSHDSPKRSHDSPKSSQDSPKRSPDSDVRLQGVVVGGMQAEGEEEPDNGKDASDDEDKFFDAQEISASESELTTVSLDTGILQASAPFSPTHKRNTSTVSMNEAQSRMTPPTPADQLPVGRERTMSVPMGPVPSFFEDVCRTIEHRRSTIPPKSNHRVSLWGIMKNCIGRDLSKIPMPVNFNEPTSFLQRMVESLLNTKILDGAVVCEDSLEEQALVMAFAASCYASTSVRIGKPFNPLLGETFECDRRVESGWRAFLEQVCHHPPMYAMHVEHKDWTLWEEYTVSSKFRGKYLNVFPIGYTHLVLHRSGHHYTWNRCISTIHNIIIGRLWVDQYGDMKVTNHTTREESTLKFYAYSYFSRERQRKVFGTVKDSNGESRYVLRGHWDGSIESARIISGDGKAAVTMTPKVLWTAQLPGPGSELIYGFSEFTSSLNEMEEGVCPTDSRFRTDQRLMEIADFDAANKDKVRLEEKQRAKRRKREAAAAKAAEAAAVGNHEEAARLEKEGSYSPLWFHKEYDPLTNTMAHVYKGGYWEGKLKGDWGVEFPDLF